MSNESDGGGSFFRDVAEQYRGVVAMAMVALVSFSAGIAVMGMRISDQVDGLREAMADVQSEQRIQREKIAKNESDVTKISNNLEALNLEEWIDQVSGLRRELCLMRYDRAGTLGPQQKQECSNLEE